MKRNNVIKVLTVIVADLLLVAIAVFAVVLSEEQLQQLLAFDLSSFDFEGFLQDKVVPTLTLGLTSISTAYVAIKPLLDKIKVSAGRFDATSAEVEKANAVAQDTVKQIEQIRLEAQQKAEQQAKVAAQMYREFQRTVDEVKQQVNDMGSSARRVEKIVSVGFGNMAELVEGGYAREIAKIEEEAKVDGTANNGEAEAE